MICATHLSLQAEWDHVDLSVVPAAVTVFQNSALCLACYWMALDEALPKAEDQ